MLINQEIPLALACAKWSKRVWLPTSQLMNNVVYFISPFVRTTILDAGIRIWCEAGSLLYCSKISEINIGLFVFLLRGICGCHLDLVFTASSNTMPTLHLVEAIGQAAKVLLLWYMAVDIMAIYNNVALFSVCASWKTKRCCFLHEWTLMLLPVWVPSVKRRFYENAHCLSFSFTRFRILNFSAYATPKQFQRGIRTYLNVLLNQ